MSEQAKNGPASKAASNAVLNKKKFEANIQVWRKGDERAKERKFSMKFPKVLPLLFSILSLQAKADDSEQMNDFWKNASCNADSVKNTLMDNTFGKTIQNMKTLSSDQSKERIAKLENSNWISPQVRLSLESSGTVSYTHLYFCLKTIYFSNRL